MAIYHIYTHAVKLYTTWAEPSILNYIHLPVLDLNNFDFSLLCTTFYFMFVTMLFALY